MSYVAMYAEFPIIAFMQQDTSLPLIHQLTVGQFECTVLGDGYAKFGFDTLVGRFPSIDPDAIRQALIALGEDPEALSTAYNTLLIRHGDRVILVDGGERTDRHTTAGRTTTCLAAVGIQPEDVDTVIISHAHGDHIVGLFEQDDETLVYPNAAYLMMPEEWAFWTAPERAGKIGTTEKWLGRLQPHLSFIDLKTPILPGLTVVPAFGHTAGHIGLLIESEGERLYHAVDIVHAPFQFTQPAWSIRFDTDPEAARQTRIDLFNRIVDESLLTLFFHMPFPGLGKVTRSGTGFVWHPL